MIGKSVEDQIRDAVRAAGDAADTPEERAAFRQLAEVMSNASARQLRRLIR